jgi:hypothetical protein
MFIKIRPGGAEFFHADGQKNGQTDGQKDRYNETNSSFSQFFERVYKGKSTQQSPLTFYNVCLLLATWYPIIPLFFHRHPHKLDGRNVPTQMSHISSVLTSLYCWLVGLVVAMLRVLNSCIFVLYSP